jgi:hypothetical protein
MRPTLILLLAAGGGIVAGTAAVADDRCDRPIQDWRPRQAIEERARSLGVEVSRIRTDDGCYKIYGRTAEGRAVEIEMDPVTLKVLETEYRDRKHRDHHGGLKHKRAAPTSPPPQGPTR